YTQMKNILIGSLIASSILMGSNSIQVNTNSDTLEVATDIYLNNSYNLNEGSNYYFTASYLRTEKNDLETQSLSSAGFKVLNPYTNDYGVSFGLGMKAVYSSQSDKRFFATPLILNGKIELNEVMYVDADLSYAPKVLSFSDGKTYQDMKVRFNYKVLSDGYVFVGVRNIETEYEDGKIKEYDNSAFVGLEVKF
ncbi:MAG: hypothetical protein ACI81I_001004, partial [Arcobacteraceae bacterium]